MANKVKIVRNNRPLIVALNYHDTAVGLTERWFRKTEQWDKWNRCLSEA